MPNLDAVQRSVVSALDASRHQEASGPAVLRTSQTQGTIVTLRLHPGRLHRQSELQTPSQLRGYRVLLGAVHGPQSHMARVQTDRYLCLELQVEVTVLALEEQQAE